MASLAPPTEATYKAWKSSTFGTEYNIWHEGLDTEAVTILTDESRTNAIAMLLYGITALNDSHCATAIAAMNYTPAIPEIRSALQTSSGEDKVRYARAIHDLSKITESPETSASVSNSMAKELISVLEQSEGHWGPPISAAISLRDFSDKESEKALLNAVKENKEYLVKYHCCNSVLGRWGVEPGQVSAHQELFKWICDTREGDVVTDKAQRGREAVAILEGLRRREG
jgi:hypothetical protein